MGGGVQEGGARDLSAQRGVTFSVVVSLVLFFFMFPFVESGGGLVSVVALCGGVGIVGAGSKTIRVKTGVCIHRRGRIEGPSQLVCTVYDEHTSSLP